MDAAIVDFDLACARCRYNLRTLHRAGVCPECGEAVARSEQVATMRAAALGRLRVLDPAWLAGMRGGLSLAIVAWIAGFVGLFYGEGDPPRAVVAGAGWLAPPVAVYVLGCAAAWRLLAPRTRRVRSRVVRAIGVAGPAAVALLFFDERWVTFYRRQLGLPWLDVPSKLLDASQIAGSLLTVAWPLATAAVAARLVQLAWLGGWRIPAVLLGLAGGALVAFAGMVAFARVMLNDFDDSGELVQALPTPTGAFVGLWRALRIVATSNGPLRSLPIVDALVPLALIASTLTVGGMLVALRLRVGQAIKLGSLDGPPAPAEAR